MEESKRRTGFRFTPGTTKLIARIKKMLVQTEDELRRYKAWFRTPYYQRSSWTGSTADLKLLATTLCAARAYMRGRQHFKGKDSKEWIETQLRKAVSYEDMLKNPHSTFPLWTRTIIQAAFAAVELEKKRKENHVRRFEQHRSAA